MSSTPAGTPSIIDDGLYQQLADFAAARRSVTAASDRVVAGEVSQVLYHEARLLDDRQYRAWLSHFSDDCIYWIPLDLAADPREQESLLLDDRRRMEDRIGLLETGWAHAQNPPSRTCRIVSNVEAWSIDSAAVMARCSVVTWEYRPRRLTPFVSRNDYVLASLGDDWMIRLKVVGLVDCDGDVRKFSFVL